MSCDGIIRHGKRELANVMKSRILSWEDLGFSRWAHSNGVSPWKWRTFPGCTRDATTEEDKEKVSFECEKVSFELLLALKMEEGCPKPTGVLQKLATALG